ncbi:hypothetical protein KR018_007621, partial [Drosophila ironensis]
KRKKLSDRHRQKKMRLNGMLRKSLMPKNALVTLNEVEGLAIGDFTISKRSDGTFIAIGFINSRQYEGQGISQKTAKNAACEKAWRDFILSRLKQTQKAAINGSVEQTDAANDGSDSQDSVSAKDNIPMLSLASYAIHKLFSQWEREGYEVPPLKGIAMPKAKPPPENRSVLPLNWETMHPAWIVSILRPGTEFQDCGTTAGDTCLMHHASIVINEKRFIACGKSKKLARSNVAAAACNSEFGTKFEVS